MRGFHGTLSNLRAELRERKARRWKQRAETCRAETEFQQGTHTLTCLRQGIGCLRQGIGTGQGRLYTRVYKKNALANGRLNPAIDLQKCRWLVETSHQLCFLGQWLVSTSHAIDPSTRKGVDGRLKPAIDYVFNVDGRLQPAIDLRCQCRC
ncbi:hypothetical protein PSHT_08177 [Puccinia striiformis]|uniref:Uncharacterized protein n=1 Tax=Puccinia striiformis TaxID=27350 RepID=A0A2S4VRP2_9BASI|nr:hypothetical protein PSHT_08177 [Puccinia striiformis]